MIILRLLKLILKPQLWGALVQKYYYQRKYKQYNLSIDFFSTIKYSDFGNNVFVANNVNIVRSFIDNHSYVNHHTSINHANIGKFCSIGPKVHIGLGNHPTQFISTHPAFYSQTKPFKTFSDNNYFTEFEPITIGNDVWIGRNSTIKGGILINDGAIIGANSIVTKDVPPYAIVGGVPATLIRYRFTQEIINDLILLKWWDLPNNFIQKHYKLFLLPPKCFIINIRTLINECKDFSTN